MPSAVEQKEQNTKHTVKTLAGREFGRWTVLNDVIKDKNGEKKWLCRCTCGTERYVLQRTLLYGGSNSCGCLRRENAARALSVDLTGKVFGELTVIRRIENTGKSPGALWLCKCACGNEYKVLGTLLINGRRSRCSGKAHKKNYTYTDITGQKFDQLTALYPTERRDKYGSVIWHCRCDCGNEIDISYNNLLYTSIVSCGCRMKAHRERLRSYKIHVDGTSLELIKSKKIPSDNTTGYRGVYLIRGKYVAKINFQKKTYHLGSYESIIEASKARAEAEQILFESTAAFYERWKEKADTDPQWAAANPVKINVLKNAANKLSVSFSPSGLQ